MATMMRSVLLLQAVFSALPILTNAHMEMSWPYPIRSQLDPAVDTADKDYSYTSPLFQDGSNFPCKGYQNGVDADIVKAVYTAGGTYNMTIAGTVVHDGGSCQLSLSYDNGATFKVIQSMIGGCPLVPGYNFTIPSYAPSSNSVLLAWTWFNLVGNREMYMDCARVEIQAPGMSRIKRSESWKRQTSMDQLPDMFVCNVNNGCTTVAGQNVNFPYPGTNVIYGQDLIVPSSGTGFTGSGFVGDGPPSGIFNGTFNGTMPGSMPSGIPTPPINLTTFSTSSTFISLATLSSTNRDLGALVTVTSGGSTTTSVSIYRNITVTLTATLEISARSLSAQEPIMTATPSSASDPCPDMTSIGASSASSPSRLTTLFPTPTASTFSTVPRTTSTQPPAAAVVPTSMPNVCTPGTFYCNTPSSFSTCISSAYSTNSNNFIYMGNVAAGMMCVNGPNGAQIVRQNAGPCTPNGQIFCNGSNAFYMCDQGGLIDMGPVAPGTQCSGGQITRRWEQVEKI